MAPSWCKIDVGFGASQILRKAAILGWIIELASAFKWKTPITGVTATAIMMGLSHRRLHARAFFLVFGVSGTKDGALTFLPPLVLGTIQHLDACKVDLYLDQQQIDTTTPPDTPKSVTALLDATNSTSLVSLVQNFINPESTRQLHRTSGRLLRPNIWAGSMPIGGRNGSGGGGYRQDHDCQKSAPSYGRRFVSIMWIGVMGFGNVACAEERINLSGVFALQHGNSPC